MKSFMVLVVPGQLTVAVDYSIGYGVENGNLGIGLSSFNPASMVAFASALSGCRSYMYGKEIL